MGGWALTGTYSYRPSTTGLQSITVGPPEAEYPVASYGGDIGAAINAAGAYAQSGGGGNVYIIGGAGTTYTASTQVVFRATVNYYGDGVVLQAASTLSNPFTTDPNTEYTYCTIAGLTLSGNNVVGTTVFTAEGAAYCTFSGLTIEAAASGAVTVLASPFTITNSSGLTQVYQVTGGTVSNVTSNGVSNTATSGVFSILPGNTLVVTYTGTPTILQAGVGLLLTGSAALGVNCPGNTFVSIFFLGCSVGMVLAGLVSPQKQTTNNVFLDLSTDPHGVVGTGIAGIVLSNNSDSNLFLRCNLQLGLQVNMAGLVYNSYSPNTDAVTYQNTFVFLTVDATVSAGQVGIVMNTNTSKPLRVLEYIAQPTLPPISAVTAHANYFIHDYGNMAVYAASGAGFKSGAWTAQTPASSGSAFTNDSFFNSLFLVSGGTVTAIAVNGQATGMISGLFTLKPGDTLTLTYSIAPTTFVAEIIGE